MNTNEPDGPFRLGEARRTLHPTNAVRRVRAQRRDRVDVDCEKEAKMRRRRPLSLAAAVAAATLALVPVGSADPGSLAVTGAGWVKYTNFPPGVTTSELTVISAHLDRSGEPHGTIVLRSPFGDVRARVTCMLAVGDVGTSAARS